MVLAVVLVALAAVLIALIVSVVLIASVALTVLIAVGIDAAVIIAEEADTVVVEDIAAEEDSFRLLIGNPVCLKRRALAIVQGLFSLSINIRDKLQYIR